MLSVEAIDVAYGEVQALWQVSLDVVEGEVSTLVGANGAGKSTLLRAIAGLVPPHRGRILFEGEPVQGKPAHEMIARGIALVPEGRHLWPAMTVLENLLLGAYNPHARASKELTLARVFEFFPRLYERRFQKAGTLSGGEQQMCAIGRGLMGLPRLLMLDEPSLGLAPMLVRELFDVISEIHSRGVTVLLVEQNVQSALEVADNAHVLENGRMTLTACAAALLGDSRVKEKFLGV